MSEGQFVWQSKAGVRAQKNVLSIRCYHISLPLQYYVPITRQPAQDRLAEIQPACLR